MITRYLVALAAAAIVMSPAVQAETFATSTETLTRGFVPGDFSGFYGGSLTGTFPEAFDEATARASVLGAPDNRFLSLPGVLDTPSGTPFPGAYVEVSFGSNFDPNTLLKIWETGDSRESAQVFLWANNGGNVQFTFTRGASDATSFNLSSYATALADIGGTSFTKVGIGGRDELGASKGFDLDAVSISPVPETEAYAMFMAGLGLISLMVRRKTARSAG
ncbi:MAG: hypothetical protein ABIR00_00930 [Nitrosospira sp.]